MGELLEKFPHTPSKLSHKELIKIILNSPTDSRRERKVRFGYRKRLGTTKTPSAKKVVCDCVVASKSKLWSDIYEIVQRREKSFIKSVQ